MQSLSIERVVVLLTPIFASAATWLATFVANNVPGAPPLDPSTLEGIGIAAFIGTVGIVSKWLTGRQIPEIVGAGGPTPEQVRALIQQEVPAAVEAQVGRYLRAAATPPPA